MADTHEVLRELFDQAWNDLNKAEGELEQARAKVDRARGKVEGLKSAMVQVMRQVGPESVPPKDKPHGGGRTSAFGVGAKRVADDDEPDWVNLNRTQAILAMLKHTGRPMGPSEIALALSRKGRTNDEPHYVSSTLDSLKRRGKVAPLGDGTWFLAESKGKQVALGAAYE